MSVARSKIAPCRRAELLVRSLETELPRQQSGSRSAQPVILARIAQACLGRTGRRLQRIVVLAGKAQRATQLLRAGENIGDNCRIGVQPLDGQRALVQRVAVNRRDAILHGL